MLFGATGTAGRGAAHALLQAGHSVVACGRSDPELRGVAFQRCDVADAQNLQTLFEHQQPDAIVSCLASRTGAPQDAWAIDHAAHLGILDAAERHRVQNFILLSAICVQKPRLAFQHAKLAFEEALMSSGLTYSIVRPTALFKSLSGQLGRVQAGKPYLMFGDGAMTSCKPISDRDLGRFIATCLTDPNRQNAVLPIGGPGPALTPRDMGAALFDAAGMPPKYRRVSPKLIIAIAAGLDVMGRMSLRAAAKADLARIGHYYATESMLVWDENKQIYDARATPEFGEDTLFDHYADLVAGRAQHDSGAHSVF